jgi:hypothetical protein
MLNSLLETSRSPPKLNTREYFGKDPFDFIEFLERIILDLNDCHKIVKIFFRLHKLSLHESFPSQQFGFINIHNLKVFATIVDFYILNG